jgi:hypothetical protein
MISSPRQPSSFRSSNTWLALLIAGMAALAVTNRSFWIDEYFVAELIKETTLGRLWERIKHYPEVQMPLYMSYIWAQTRVFGTSEWLMRAAGIPWFVAGAIVFLIGMRRVIGTALVPALVVSSSAFAWYYLNEARVYSLQMGMALALAGSGAALIQSLSANQPVRGWMSVFLASLWLLCATSVLGAMWGFFLFAGFAFIVPRSHWWPLLRMAPFGLTVCALGLAALAGYYAWTTTLQPKPTPGETTVQTALFACYEIIGASGLGPGRIDLRANGIGALKPFAIPLTLFLATGALVLWQGLREFHKRCGWRRTGLFLGMMALPFIVLCTLGVFTHMRVLGRHATPLLPLVLVLFAFGIVRLTRSNGAPGRIIASLFLFLSLVSCLSVRFASRHEKDDYRSAAHVAKVAVAEGKKVWWNANDMGADYYQVPVQKDFFQPGLIKLILNRSEDDLRSLPEPDIVIASKPDLFDRQGGLDAYLRRRGFRPTAHLPAFTIWSR